MTTSPSPTPDADGDAQGAGRDVGEMVERVGLVEMVDVVDDDDRVVATVPRSVVRAQRLLHRAVFIVVVHPDGRVLIHQRSGRKDVWPSRWDLAVGGVVAAGETYANAAARELAEEVGIVDAELHEVGFAGFRDADVALHGRCYRVVHPGPFTFADGEVVAAEWVAIGDLARLAAERSFVPDSLALAGHLLRDL